MSDPELSIQVPHLLDLVLASNAPSTTSKYSYGWACWRRWTQSKQGVSFMPSVLILRCLKLLEVWVSKVKVFWPVEHQLIKSGYNNTSKSKSWNVLETVLSHLNQEKVEKPFMRLVRLGANISSTLRDVRRLSLPQQLLMTT